MKDNKVRVDGGQWAGDGLNGWRYLEGYLLYRSLGAVRKR